MLISRISFKAEPSSLAHTSIHSTVFMPDSHIWSKNFSFHLISCAFPYTWVCHSHTPCAQSHTSWREFIWDSKEYQQMDNNQHLTAMTYILIKQNLGTTLIPSWIIQRSSNSGPELLLTDLDLMKASENSH